MVARLLVLSLALLVSLEVRAVTYADGTAARVPSEAALRRTRGPKLSALRLKQKLASWRRVYAAAQTDEKILLAANAAKAARAAKRSALAAHANEISEEMLQRRREIEAQYGNSGAAYAIVEQPSRHARAPASVVRTASETSQQSLR